MLKTVEFNQSQVDEITDQLLPSPGRILSGKKRQEILLAMTTEITGLLVPVDQKEAMVSMNSLSESLDAAIPPVRSIMSKATRKDVQNQIAMLVKAEFAAHNTKVESDARVERERMSHVPPVMDLDPYEELDNDLPSPVLKYLVVSVLLLAACGALYMVLR